MTTVELFQLLSLVAAAALCFSGLSFPENSSLGKLLRLIVKKRYVVLTALASVAFFGALIVATLLHEPKPRVHDEFSYLLMSDTFASGRVANLTPPLPEFFDTFHVLMRPVYASKYFPAPGLFLAIGQRLSGHPAAGVWLSSALACAAVYWMLQAWIGPTWALLGGFLMVVQFGIYSYWSQTYWGGMVAALGGALFFGAGRRLWDRFDTGNAIWLALGVVVLVNSRPLEGLLTMLPMTILLLPRLWRLKGWRRREFWLQFVLPAGFVLFLGAAATCSYNYAITGSMWKTPYMLHEQQYQQSPFLSFLPLRPKITYSSPWVQYYYEVTEMAFHNFSREPAWLMSLISLRFVRWWAFYCGVLLTPALLLPSLLRSGRIRFWPIGILAGLIVLFAVSGPSSTFLHVMIDVLLVAQICILWIVFDGFWPRLAMLTCFLLMLEQLTVKVFFPHYFAPAACLVLFLQLDGLRRVWHWKNQSELSSKVAITRSERRRMVRSAASVSERANPWRGYVTMLPLLCLISLVVRIEARVNGWSEDLRGPSRRALLMSDWSLRRAELERWLEQQAAPQLVFVRYSQRHDVQSEWVYNRADLVHSHVVWARDLGADHNQLLLKQMPERTVWILYADNRDPQLVPYSEAVAPAGSPSPKTHGTPEEDRQD